MSHLTNVPQINGNILTKNLPPLFITKPPLLPINGPPYYYLVPPASWDY